MNDALLRSHFRWWVRLCSLIYAVVSCCSLPATRAQDLDKPLQSIDEEITAFAYAPDGRIVYSVNRKFKTKFYDLEHDDIWLQEASGIPVEFWDERLTTVEAERVLRQSGISIQKRAKAVDRLAAVILLSSYLDSRNL